MYMAIVALHVVLSLALIGIVILQPGKGGDIGAAFGGAGGSTIFGPRGPGSVLQSITTGVAVAFMCTSITLAYFSNEALLAGTGDVMEELERRNDARIEADQAAADEAEDAALDETLGVPASSGEDEGAAAE